MSAYAVLFAHDELPTSTTDWGREKGQFDGWAEWFTSVPLLFSFLLGDQRYPPRRAAHNQYHDNQTLSVLVAPMAQVRERWSALKSQVEALHPGWSDAQRQQWQGIDEVITRSPRHWLVLDCASLSSGDIGTPEFERFLDEQYQRCQQWDAREPLSERQMIALVGQAEPEWGWWGPGVAARAESIECQQREDWPGWLREHYDLCYFNSWNDDLDAYLVRPLTHPHSGQRWAEQDEAQKENWPVGFVTPYGRWLLHPDAGATLAFTSGGYINVHFATSAARDGRGSCLMDLNGREIISSLSGFKEICALTSTVMQCRSFHHPQLTALYHIPTGELLADALQSVSVEDDRMIRAKRDGDGIMQVLDQQGKPVFASDYQQVYEFNLRYGLAAAFRHDAQAAEGERFLMGVINLRGEEIVPCEFKMIQCGLDGSTLKIYPGGKLLAFSHTGQPWIYSSKGALLCAPAVWCPPGRYEVKKNAVLVFAGQGEDAECGWFSLKDFTFDGAGITREAYYAAMRQALTTATSEPEYITREALVAAEDTRWMQNVADMLSLGEPQQAEELLQHWRRCVSSPDRDDFDCDEDDDIDVMALEEDNGVLQLYWQHLQVVSRAFARFDWKDSDALASLQWLPGAADWHWDWKLQGDSMDDGAESLAAHIRTRGMALIQLDTGDDSLHYTVVRQADAQAFVELLSQANVRALPVHRED